ncbi:hypothetical protein CHUAL_014105 [Chamberlinius hualienensis]
MVLRIKEVTKEEDALDWLKKLNEVGLAIWRVKRTFPRVGKTPISNIFKQDMRCQHSTPKVLLGNKKNARNTDCPAVMTILVKRTDIKYSRAAIKDTLLKDWPCIVKFSGKHNHDLYTTRPREISDELKQQLIVYFHKGHSPTSAFHTLKTSLLIHQPSLDFTDQFLPDRAVCAYLYHTEFKPQLHDPVFSSHLTNLSMLINNYNETTDGRAVLKIFEDGRKYLALCSPIMSRTHQLIVQSSELMFVDSIVSSSLSNICLHVFYTVTPTGGLPLGVIITDGTSDVIFQEALSALISECFPKTQFYKKGYPDVIMNLGRTDNFALIQKCFPKSTCLRCQLSVLRQSWRWITDPTSEIDRHDRINVLQHLRELMYSPDENRFNESLQKISSHYVMNNYPKFRFYLNELCSYQREWALCYRLGLPLRKHHTDGYARPNILMLEQVMKKRKGCFNMTQLFDFISTVYESFLAKILTAYSVADVPFELMQKYVPFHSLISEEDIVKHACDDDLFLVKSSDKPERFYSVNVARFSCNCFEGLTTKICKHLSAVLEHKMLGTICIESFNLAQSRKLIGQVASGKMDTDVGGSSCAATLDQPMETNGLPPLTFDHEELIQSEENPIADLRAFTERIIQVSKDNPDVFIPALKAMMMSAQQYANNEAGLAVAMQSFGKYSGYETIGYILENVDGL